MTFIKKHQASVLIILLLIFLIPTFWKMLKPGIFSMADFPAFRLYEYNKCILDLQFPCRWSPDSAFEYGEPIFNYYGQLPFLFGEVFKLMGFTILDSLKLLFILSFLGSGISMFILSKQLWKDNFAALLSGLIYAYAPYRSVDVYVRGALPEAMAFVFLPITTYFFNLYIFKRKKSSLFLFSFCFAVMVVVHNLSVLIYSIFLIFWGSYLLTKHKAWVDLWKIILSLVLSFGLAAFYLLPVIFEANYVNLAITTQGYFDFHNHFVTLNQLLLSQFWGYGASVWGSGDGLSLAVGQIQWVLPIICLILIIAFRRFKKSIDFLVLFLIGWVSLFLTHNKSTFVWEFLSFFKFLQFPWRFLELAIFVFSLAGGVILLFIQKNNLKILITLLFFWMLLVLNFNFFKEDIWFNVSDNQFFSGQSFKLQTASSINDYWPVFGKTTPTELASKDVIFKEGSGSGQLIDKKSNSAKYNISLNSGTANIELPMVYFPGWVAKTNESFLSIYPSGDFGLITANVDKNVTSIELSFENTFVRTIGNIISLISILILVVSLLKFKHE